MGGKGKGVFSDVRMARVCFLRFLLGVHVLEMKADKETDQWCFVAVSIPCQCAGGKDSGSEEGALVEC
jgi:hypothetical protein